MTGVADGPGGDRPALHVVRDAGEDDVAASQPDGGVGCPVSITVRGFFEVAYFRDALARAATEPPSRAMTELAQINVALGMLFGAIEDGAPEGTRPDIRMDFGERNGTSVAVIRVCTGNPRPDQHRCG